MLEKQKFYQLKEQLTNVMAAIQRGEEQFQPEIMFYEYMQNLNELYYEFLSEIRQNKLILKEDEEMNTYLDMLLHVFDMLDEQNGIHPDFTSCCTAKEKLITNRKQEKKACEKSERAFMRIAYFQYQKIIIQKCIKSICHSRKNRMKTVNHHSSEGRAWKEELKEFYPDMIRIKDRLSQIPETVQKINCLQKERQKQTEKMEEKGRNLYHSPLNLFFETRLECYKDILVLESEIQNRQDAPFTWNASKTDFLELITALDKVKAIKDKNGKPVSRKELIHQFEKFLNMQTIPDPESRINKLLNRSTPTPFLDYLQEKTIPSL